MADSILTFEVTDLSRATIFWLYGEFDLAAESIFDESILPMFDGKPTVVDLSGLTFFDSAGLFCLLKARDKLSDSGGSLRVMGGDGLLEQWNQFTKLFETNEPSKQAAHRHVVEVRREGARRCLESSRRRGSELHRRS